MKPPTLAIVLALALLAGCETEAPAGKTGYAPTDPAKVMILKRVPTVPYEELGKVRAAADYSAQGTGAATLDLTGSASISELLRAKGAAMGADAIILKEETIADPIDSGGDVQGGSTEAGASRRIMAMGIAIKFKVPSPPPVAPAKSAP